MILDATKLDPNFVLSSPTRPARLVQEQAAIPESPARKAGKAFEEGDEVNV